MNLEELLGKYGRVTARFVGGKVQGTINGYSIEIEKIQYAYTVLLFLNGGIRKFFETIEQLESFLHSLT